MKRLLLASAGVAAALGMAVACGSSGSGGGSASSCDAGCIDGQVTKGPPGQLDPSYGVQGVALLPRVGGPGDYAYFRGIQLAQDGSLFIAAYSSSTVGVLHVNPNGSVDDKYGSGGLAKTPGELEGVNDGAAFAVDSMLRAVFAQIVPGDSGTGSAGYALVRLSAGGTPDTTFGNGGTAGPFQMAPAFTPYFIVPRKDGKLLLVGNSDQSATPFAFALHAADGSSDAAFGGVKVDSSGAGAPTQVLVLDDGSLVATTGDALRHYDANGNLDSSFGSAGVATVPLASDGGGGPEFALTSTASAGGVSFGYSQALSGGGVYLGAARFSSNGAPDTTFGGGGAVAELLDGSTGRPHVSGAAAVGDRVALGGFWQTGVGSGRAWLAELTQDAGLSAAFDDGVNGDGGFAHSGAYEVKAVLREPGTGKLLVAGTTGTRLFVARVFP